MVNGVSLPPPSTENDSAKGNMVFLGSLWEREVSSVFILLKSKLSVTNIFLPLELKLLRFAKELIHSAVKEAIFARKYSVECLKKIRGMKLK